MEGYKQVLDIQLFLPFLDLHTKVYRQQSQSEDIRLACDQNALRHSKVLFGVLYTRKNENIYSHRDTIFDILAIVIHG